jgi:hypothetical protein
MTTLIGRRIKLHESYNGFTDGTIVEELIGCRFGIHLDGYDYNGKPITVDFCRGEFALLRLPERLPCPAGVRGLDDEQEFGYLIGS